MDKFNTVTTITPTQMQETFSAILVKNGFELSKAIACAQIFTESSVDGVYTHGVNRFPVFIEYVRKGFVIPDAEPILRSRSGAIEQWDGNLGPGPSNAIVATDAAIRLAKDFGFGCVAMANTNHWMRGGTYGWKAARQGFSFIGFSNTKANMPAWGATDRRVGNNPLVIAVPHDKEAIVLDMAMSQYSFGAMEQASIKEETLSVDGGYNKDGELTKEPKAIIESGRLLPMGYWKGAGLALMLDLLSVILAGGKATHEVDRQGAEYGLSQVFIAIDISRLDNFQAIQAAIAGILKDYQESIAINKEKSIFYPGERVLSTRKQNTLKGIPVQKEVWAKILSL
jgi:3-dehydro-L-gulonate 2-dehydrogenase